MRKLALRLGTFGLLAAVAGALFINLCHLIYQCGCVSLWAGGAAWCNIQTAGPPDCPFCAHPDVAYASLLTTIGAQGLVVFWPAKPGLAARALVGLAAFPAVTLGYALPLGLVTGYWS